MAPTLPWAALSRSSSARGARVDLLDAYRLAATQHPDADAHSHRGERLTYGELWERSGRLAAALTGVARSVPIVVHGHKQGWMPVCFLACARSGHPYVPVDSSIPDERLREIVTASGTPLVLAVEPVAALDTRMWTLADIERRATDPEVAQPPREDEVGDDEPYYVIYTSGSTGTPKGVEISRGSVGRFAAWAASLLPEGATPGVFLNQAPFSFDLSVFELAMAPASASVMHSIDAQHVARLPDLFEDLRTSGVTVWVSTPSFVDLCLADRTFGQRLLPDVRAFLFCGETLSNETARGLIERFPRARVVNTYGPTESTVAVTSVVCEADIILNHPVLPVGTPRPGTDILIRDPEGRILPEGHPGEIVIVGDTVALGYHRRPDLTASVFETIDGRRAYRTGDRGTIVDGQLFFGGRLDLQVKLHGYRIEVEDVEAHLRRLDDVAQAVVVPVERPGSPGTVAHLHAIVQLTGPAPERPLPRVAELKRALRALLPDYMIPKAITFAEAIPLTPNGKVDRRAARRLVR